MKLPATFSRRARKTFFVLHLWTGLVLGAWFAMMGLTGSVLAWLPDLLPMELRARYPLQNPNAPMVSPEVALQGFQKAHPKAKAGYLGAPAGQFSHYFTLLPNPQTKEMDVVWLDPSSGRAHPPLPVEGLATGWIAHFHADLHSGPRGLIANGVGSAFGVLMLLSGLWLWWPSNLKQLRERVTVSPTRNVRRRLLDLHNVMGIYLFGLLFITTLTGALLVLNGQTDDGLEKRIDKLAGAKPEATVTVKPSGARQKLDTLIDTARAQMPGHTLSGINLPTKPDAPLSATFQRDGGLLKNAKVTMNPYTGRVLSVERDATASPGHKSVGLMWDLHLGTFGGVPTKLLYTLAGLMPTGLFITGVWLWLRPKLRQRARLRAPESELVASS